MPAPRSRGHRRSSASSVMLSINASFKSGTALTYFSWRRIVSNCSAKSNYFLMSPIRQSKSVPLRAALWRFGLTRHSTRPQTLILRHCSCLVSENQRILLANLFQCPKAYLSPRNFPKLSIFEEAAHKVKFPALRGSPTVSHEFRSPPRMKMAILGGTAVS